MKTRITELLGCEYPLIQGGMAWVAEHKLAAAVSNAGGIGLIAGGSAPIDYLREQIRACKSATDKPFGVNIMLMSPNAEDPAQLVIDEGVAVVIRVNSFLHGKKQELRSFLLFLPLLLQREWKRQVLTLSLPRARSQAVT